VERLYTDGVFPELSNVPFGDIIGLCWRQEAESAQELIELVRRSSAPATKAGNASLSADVKHML
jgi:hypothetical protein